MYAIRSYYGSYIGYWGDHQIIYLLKFIEALRRVSPGALENLLDREIFCYADVPYRLKPYEAILADPHTTIDYDSDLASRIDDRVNAIGADGKLLPGNDQSIYHVNLLEKLLVPALSKLSNRITSYNVCYTKLLRIVCVVPLGSLRVHPDAAAGDEVRP